MKREHPSLIDALWGSWGSGAFYRNALHAPLRTALVLIGMALLLVTVVVGMVWRSHCVVAFDQFYESYGQFFPTLAVSADGIASVTGAHQPFVHTFGEQDFTIAFDTSGRLRDLNSYTQGLLATTDALVIRNWALVERRIPWNEALPVLALLLGAEQVSPRTIYAARNRIAMWGALVVAAGALLGAISLSVTSVLLFGSTAIVMARSRDINLSYRHAYRICVFALFPPVLLFSLVYGIDPETPTPVLLLVCGVLYSVLVVRGVFAQASLHAEDEPEDFL